MGFTGNDNMGVVALKPIHAGEEICIMYVVEQSLLQPTQGRRQMLHSMFGFNCKCLKCLSVSDPVRAFSCHDPKCSGSSHMINKALSGCSVCGKNHDVDEAREDLQREATVVGIYR